MFAQVQTISLIDALAIILSIVSLIITIVGFFASLKFYRDGIELQKSANDALTKLEEKTQFIQTQVGGMFDKTLDAAIGKREALSANFEELNEQLEKAKSKIIEESVKEIGAVGEQERGRISQLVNGQMELIRKRIETTRESAENIAQTPDYPPSFSKILTELANNNDGLTIEQIIKRTKIPPSTVRDRLDKLYEMGHVGTKDDKYYNITGVLTPW